MIGLLTPWPLLVAGTLSAVTVVLHLLSVRRPPVLSLPTARFIAPRDVRAVSRSARPTDLLLLLLRVLALLLAGTALSGPRWIPASRPLGHVIVADPSWRADSARLTLLAGVTTSDDPAVRIAWVRASTTSADGAALGMRGELGAALPVAWREAALLLAAYPATDSIALHVFAPSRTAGIDGWDAWRATWPGRARVHAREDSGPATPDTARTIELRVTGASGDDHVVASLALHGASLGVRRADARTVSDPTVRTVLLQRGGTGSARGGADSPDATPHVTIVWPEDGRPGRWQARGRSDTAPALVASGSVIAAPWGRSAAWNPGSGPGTAIAWWNDGTPAVVERGDDSRCTREVGVLVPAGGDALLAPSARALLAALLAPCGAWRGAPVPARVLADSSGAALPSAAVRAALPMRASVTPAWLPAALLGAALALLLIEWLVRRRGAATADRASTAHDTAPGVRSAA